MKNIEKNMNLLNRIFFIATIVWMIIIFIFSHQTGEDSADFSGSITKAIVETIINDFDTYSDSKQQLILEKANYIIRKGAHFTEYGILGMFSILTLLTHMYKNNRRYDKCTTNKLIRFNMLYAFLFSALYAVSDEIHQNFTDNRSPAILDVAIDSSGALCAILFISLLFYFLYVKKLINENNNQTNIKRAEL